MIYRVPEIDGVRIVRTAQDWNQPGVIGFASVCVDGVRSVLIILIRGIDGEVDQHLSVRLPGAELPAFVLDPDLRDRIWIEVDMAIEAWDAEETDE